MPVDVTVVTVPYDCGRRSFRMGRGPEVLRRLLVGEDGAIHSPASVEVTLQVDEHAPEIARWFSALEACASEVASVVRRRELPLVLGGNCATAAAVLSGHHQAGAEVPALLWFDCHGDFHTPETTSSGFLDGTALSLACGRAWGQMAAATLPGLRRSHAAACLVGGRSVEETEASALEASGVEWVVTDEVEQVRRWSTAHRGHGVHVHVDADVYDPVRVGPANGFQTAGGLDAESLRTIVAGALNEAPLRSVSLASYDPGVDPDGDLPPVLVDVARLLVAEWRQQRVAGM